jgi:hypothetical protein
LPTSVAKDRSAIFPLSPGAPALLYKVILIFPRLGVHVYRFSMLENVVSTTVLLYFLAVTYLEISSLQG